MMLDKRNPGAEGAGALEAAKACEARSPDTNRRRRAKQAAVAVIRDRDRTRHVVVAGRQLWALRQLLAAGPSGCSTLRNPALRWSSYVHRLREKGLDIETRREQHGGAYPGAHGIYILHSDVQLEPLAEAEGET